MLIIYNILFAFLLIALSPLLFLFALLGGHRPLKRLGFLPKSTRGTVWIHSASIGEASVAIIIRDIIKKIDPEKPIMFTANTKPALKKIEQLKSDNDIVSILPLDIFPVMCLAMRRANPSCIIVVETELWPNMLVCARRKKIPVFLLNGRISSKTMRWARFFPVTFNMLTNCIEKFAMKSQVDAENLSKCGVPESKIEVFGNIKFAGVPGIVEPIYFDRKPVIVASSVRSREFSDVIRAFLSVKEKFPSALFIFAPRHKNSFPLAHSALQNAGVEYATRSESPSPGQASFYLLDTIGELVRFFPGADLAFIGGTLANYGGHNPLEPAYFGVPVLFGPHNYANKEAYDILIETGGGRLVNDYRELSDTIIEILRNPQTRDSIGAKARSAVEIMQPILLKYEKLIEEFLKKI